MPRPREATALRPSPPDPRPPTLFAILRNPASVTHTGREHSSACKVSPWPRRTGSVIPNCALSRAEKVGVEPLERSRPTTATAAGNEFQNLRRRIFASPPTTDFERENDDGPVYFLTCEIKTPLSLPAYVLFVTRAKTADERNISGHLRRFAAASVGRSVSVTRTNDARAENKSGRLQRELRNLFTRTITTLLLVITSFKPNIHTPLYQFRTPLLSSCRQLESLSTHQFKLNIY